MPIDNKISLIQKMWAIDKDSLQKVADSYEKINAKTQEMLQDKDFMKATNDNFWPQEGDWACAIRPYNVKAGILSIPITGCLEPEMGFVFQGIATGYPYIVEAVQRGMEDEDVMGIEFLINSPGGDIQGLFETGEFIFNNRGKKPMVAFVQGNAFSAAYNLAAQADLIYMTKSSQSGSVGVITVHIEESKYLADLGVKPTIIYAGANKKDGNHYEPLTAVAEKRKQDRTNDVYDIFVDSVARGRGISAQHVRTTKALTYGADQSVEIGFADNVGNFEEHRAAFESRAAIQYGEGRMTIDKDKNPTTAKQDGDTTNDVATQLATATEAAKLEGAGEATTALMERATAVMAMDEYKGRETYAAKLLNDPKMVSHTAEEIKAYLTDYPLADAKAEVKSDFEQGMDDTGGAGVGGEQKKNPEGGEKSRGQRLKEAAIAQGIIAKPTAPPAAT